jgi:hypothetical protein
MGGEVMVESEGIGHGTSFIIKMQAISKIFNHHHCHNLI